MDSASQTRDAFRQIMTLAKTRAPEERVHVVEGVDPHAVSPDLPTAPPGRPSAAPERCLEIDDRALALANGLSRTALAEVLSDPTTLYATLHPRA